MKKSRIQESRKRMLALGMAVVLAGSNGSLPVWAEEQPETSDVAVVMEVNEETETTDATAEMEVTDNAVLLEQSEATALTEAVDMMEEETMDSLTEENSPVSGNSLEKAVVKLENGQWTYDGTEKEPVVKEVTLDGKILNAETDYAVSYDNNVNAGTQAKVIITGQGNYEGTASTTFEISKKWLRDLTFEGMQESYEYTGKEIRPEFTLKNGNEIIPESQYTVTYLNNIKPETPGVYAAVRVSGIKDGNYNIDIMAGTKNFRIFHEHDWKYKSQGWVIYLECQKAVCPCSGGRATLVLYVDDYNGIKYNGKTQDLGWVMESPSGAVPSIPEIIYAGDGLENGLPKNAGEYTASITYGGVTASYTFEIEKADPQIGTVTTTDLVGTLDVNQVQLSRTDITVPGTLKLKEGTELQYGTHDYTWVFEPDDSTNYNSVEGTVSITVKDTDFPTASWRIGNSGWNPFSNTFGRQLVCQNTETMEIEFFDESSGIASKQYYIAERKMSESDLSNAVWTDYTDPISLPLGRNQIVYVKIRDNTGNEVILNSPAFVVYQESTIEYGDTIDYIYKEDKLREIYIACNGNAFYELVDEFGHSLPKDAYGYDEIYGRLTLASNYLSSLSVGTHRYRIDMVPQGVQEVDRIALYFQVKVEKAKLYVIDVRAKGKVYDGSRSVEITEVTLGREDGEPYRGDVSVQIDGLRGTLESADAGTYKELTLPELTVTGKNLENYELIQPKELVRILWGVTISKKEAPVIQPVDKSYVYAKDTKENIDLSSLLPEDCGEITYGEPSGGANEFAYYSSSPKINDGILSYTVGKTTWEELKQQKTGELQIPVQMTNYEDTVITLRLSLQDQTDVILKKGTQVSLQNDTLTYGESLSKLVLEEAVFTDEAGNVIEGTFGWEDASWQPPARTTEARWIFVPSDAKYKTVTGTIAITVKKAVPEIQNPATVEERTWHPKKTLTDEELSSVIVLGADDAKLSGTWSWKQKDLIPEIDNDGYEAVFTPADDQNYEVITTTIEVPVKKAIPVIAENPVASEISWGESLADSDLSGGKVQYKGLDDVVLEGSFSWKDSTVKPNVADSNQTTYTVIFTPEDTAHYESVETMVTLTVKPVGKAPNLPEEQMKVSYQIEKVKNVQLPEGWTWKVEDLEKDLVAGDTVHAIAVYTGKNQGNYEVESVEVAITRLEEEKLEPEKPSEDKKDPSEDEKDPSEDEKDPSEDVKDPSGDEKDPSEGEKAPSGNEENTSQEENKEASDSNEANNAAQLVKTGDTSNLILWMMLLVISGSLLMGTTFFFKKIRK